MKWFKFYGTDFLADMKMSQLSILERMVWVTLLCLAHEEDKSGNVRYCTEVTVLHKMGISGVDKEWSELIGVFKKFIALDMIEMTENGIFVRNFAKRQETNLIPSEKMARYRAKKHESNKSYRGSVTNVTQNRIEESRIDIIIPETSSDSPPKGKEAQPSGITNLSKKKQPMWNKYNESESSDSNEPSIDLDTRELSDPKKKDPKVMEKYNLMLAWAEKRRGFPFVAKVKQYKAFKMAKESELSPAKLQDRWVEFESDSFRNKVGWDWMDVVTSFNKKQ